MSNENRPVHPRSYTPAQIAAAFGIPEDTVRDRIEMHQVRAAADVMRAIEEATETAVQ